MKGFFLIAFIGLQVSAHGQGIDTTGELRKMVEGFKSLKNLGYDYVKSAQFPNGQKDKLKGEMYVNNDKMLLFDDCDAYTMIYNGHWFYKANHRKKTITIVNLDKEYDKKLKKATEKDIFQNGALEKFLDSVVLKTAVVKKLDFNADTVKVIFGFPASQPIRSIAFSYTKGTVIPISYDVVMKVPWQKTTKGVQSIDVNLKCNNFRKPEAESKYNQDNYFAYESGRLKLKRFNNYKLSTKM